MNLITQKITRPLIYCCVNLQCRQNLTDPKNTALEIYRPVNYRHWHPHDRNAKYLLLLPPNLHLGKEGWEKKQKFVQAIFLLFSNRTEVREANSIAREPTVTPNGCNSKDCEQIRTRLFLNSLKIAQQNCATKRGWNFPNIRILTLIPAMARAFAPCSGILWKLILASSGSLCLWRRFLFFYIDA